jgi:hypothetical protein
MNPKPALPEDEKGLGRLVLDLLWQIALLVAPAMLVAWLPPWQALVVYLGVATAMWVCARLGWMRAGRGASSLMTSVAFGLGFSVLRALPAYWDLAGGFVGVVGALACSAWWERKLGLAPPLSAQSGGWRDTVSGASRPSNWSGPEAEFTPEGAPIRSFNHSEIAMGGPTYCDYLFDDGVLLEGIGTYLRFSRDARYLASPVPSRSGWHLVVFDRQRRRLYRCAASDAFWELAEFSDAVASRTDPAERDLAAYLADAEAVDLVAVADLWVEPGSWQTAVALTSFERVSPGGQHRLTGRLYLPASLRTLADPTGPLRRPEYRIELDGVPSGLVMAADVVLVWREDGQALCGEARWEPVQQGNVRQGDETASSPYWYWESSQGWRALPPPWVAADGEPSFYPHEVVALDAEAVRIAAYLDYPQPDHGTYGYALHSIHGDTETVVGHDAKGRMLVADLKLTRTQLVVPLTGRGERGRTALESDPLNGGVRARFDWLRDNRAGQGAYTCTIGDWVLPGEWLLDHRVSDDGRYLALVPFASAPAIPGHASVADTQARRLLQSPPLLAACLLDFRGGLLSLAVVRGRLHKDATSTPLHRIDTPAPDASRGAAFVADREDSRLYYERRTLQVEVEAKAEAEAEAALEVAGAVCAAVDGATATSASAAHALCGLTLLPSWREVSRPQLATADGDFVQPAPDACDAAWMFGCDTKYGDSWLRARESRMGGYVLTASGCGVADLAPSMIWSRGSCYLALTRMQTEVHEHDEYRSAWRVLLLDVEKHTLRTWPTWLYSRPLFDSFAATALHVRLFDSDWEDFGRPGSRHDAGTVTRIAVKDLLDLPAEPLVACGHLWLPASEQSNAAAWLALDRSALRRWTTQRAAQPLA